MPTNLYGPGDNFDLAASHVIPAMLRKCHEAKAGGGPVEIWGTGTPRREFLFVDDAADALVFLMERYSAEDIINVGGGEDARAGGRAGGVGAFANAVRVAERQPYHRGVKADANLALLDQVLLLRRQLRDQSSR